MLIQSVKKEALIIANDLHSLAVLILLPITFMLIMTLAMGEKQEQLIRKINIQLQNPTYSTHTEAMSLYLKNIGFRLDDSDSYDLKIRFNQEFDQTLLTQQKSGHIQLEFTEELSPQTNAMVLQLIKATLSKLKLHAYMQDMEEFDDDLSLEEKVQIVEKSASVDYLLEQAPQKQLMREPTLYSIPSWLIFGIYFIVLPISTTLIREKQNGTLLRIQTYPISTSSYFFNKALSYSVVSSLQWILLSLVGFYLVPWLTEQSTLILNNSVLYLISAFFVIWAAIGFAFFLASLVNTFEQAIVLGGGINILLAAFSGFMVPIDIMPDLLAQIATFSPMYWSAALVKQSLAGESLAQASTYLFALGLFGSVCLSVALIIFNYKKRQLSWS